MTLRYRHGIEDDPGIDLANAWRDRTERVLDSDGWRRVVLWAVAPALCIVLPGPGAILAFVWIVALLKVGRQPFASLGLTRPRRWLAVMGSGLVIAVLVTLLSDYAIEPFSQWLTGQPPDTSRIAGIAGNWQGLALFLALSWLVGAVVEETVFRGFMIGYGTRVLGKHAIWPLALFSSATFGFSHLYQGAAGVVLTGSIGFVLAATYIVSKKNLPLVMFVHGFVDTISILALFIGLEKAS